MSELKKNVIGKPVETLSAEAPIAKTGDLSTLREKTGIFKRIDVALDDHSRMHRTESRPIIDHDNPPLSLARARRFPTRTRGDGLLGSPPRTAQRGCPSERERRSPVDSYPPDAQLHRAWIEAPCRRRRDRNSGDLSAIQGRRKGPELLEFGLALQCCASLG